MNDYYKFVLEHEGFLNKYLKYFDKNTHGLNEPYYLNFFSKMNGRKFSYIYLHNIYTDKIIEKLEDKLINLGVGHQEGTNNSVYNSMFQFSPTYHVSIKFSYYTQGNAFHGVGSHYFINYQDVLDFIENNRDVEFTEFDKHVVGFKK